MRIHANGRKKAGKKREGAELGGVRGRAYKRHTFKRESNGGMVENTGQGCRENRREL